MLGVDEGYESAVPVPRNGEKGASGEEVSSQRSQMKAAFAERGATWREQREQAHGGKT